MARKNNEGIKRSIESLNVYVYLFSGLAFDPIPLDALSFLTLGFYFLTMYVSASVCSTLLVKFAFIKFSSYFMEISLVKVQIVCFLGKLTWISTFVALDQFGPINSPPIHYLLFVPNERYTTDRVNNINQKYLKYFQNDQLFQIRTYMGHYNLIL